MHCQQQEAGPNVSQNKKEQGKTQPTLFSGLKYNKNRLLINCVIYKILNTISKHPFLALYVEAVPHIKSRKIV